jgi:ribosomal protein S18 acetylase RimI-like enzyme
MGETLEYGLLQHIKTCLQCNNESQAIRLLEKYGFEKQEERYSEEEVIELLNKREDCINQTSSIFDYTSAKDWFEQNKK